MFLYYDTHCVKLYEFRTSRHLINLILMVKFLGILLLQTLTDKTSGLWRAESCNVDPC